MMRNRHSRRSLGLLAALALAFCSALTAAGSAGTLTASIEDDPVFQSFHWVSGRAAMASGATLVVPPGARALTGSDDGAFIKRYGPDYATGEEGVLDFDGSGTARYAFCRCGYSEDDFSASFDGASALEPRIEVAAKDAQGDIDAHNGLVLRTRILGFAQAPRYSPSLHAFAWVFRINEFEKPAGTVGEAIVFTRYGHEMVRVETRDGQLGPTWKDLLAAIRAIDVRPGKRYADHRPGDAYGPGVMDETTQIIRGGFCSKGRPPAPIAWTIAPVVAAVVVLGGGLLYRRRRRRRSRRAVPFEIRPGAPGEAVPSWWKSPPRT